MTRTSKGFRSGTRKKLSKKFRSKFKPENYMQEFKPRSKVIIRQNPSSQKGMPYPKFRGEAGEIKGKRGKAYIVEVKIGNKKRELIVRPEHLIAKK